MNTTDWAMRLESDLEAQGLTRIESKGDYEPYVFVEIKVDPRDSVDYNFERVLYSVLRTVRRTSIGEFHQVIVASNNKIVRVAITNSKFPTSYQIKKGFGKPKGAW